MKKLLVLGIFLVSPAMAQQTTNIAPIHFSSGTLIADPPKAEVVWIEGNLEICGGNPLRRILIIDRDGDIFLRGKWVGWDGRFKDIFNKVWGRR